MKNSSKILVALGAGLAIGGLLGVLFAPLKGADTRKKITDAGTDMAGKLKDKINSGKDAIAGLRDEAENIIAMAKNRS
jgi:gas vesicle protein